MARIEAQRSFDNTLAFVTDKRVSSVPIGTKVLTPPIVNSMNQDRWQRMWYITGAYLGIGKSLQEIGKDFGITRERVRIIVKTGVEQLHQVQSKRVKGKFPLDKFAYRKPSNHSGTRGESIAAEVERRLAKGEVMSQIREELGSAQVNNAREALRRRGVEFPYVKRPILPRFEKLRDSKLSDEEKQKLLDGVRNHRVLRVLSSGEEPLIAFVSKIGRQAGLFFRNDKVNIIYAVLKSKGIPISSYSRFSRSHGENKDKTRITTYFICASDRDRAIGIINSAKELDQFRVNPITVLGKAVDGVPRNGELRRSRNYLPLGSLIVEVTGKRLSGVRTDDVVLADCPVSVFRESKSHTFYRLDQQKQLRKYLKRRLRELKLV